MRMLEVLFGERDGSCGMGRIVFSRVLAVVMFFACLPAFAFNNDGKPDILWRNGGNNSSWFMDGTGYVSGSAFFPNLGDSNWVMVASGDFNNDAQFDILFHNSALGFNQVWMMNGSNYVSSVPLADFGDVNWEPVGTGYFGGSNDTSVDILWRNKVHGTMVVWHMIGTAFSSVSNLITNSDLNWKVMGTGDFNHDGHTDIAWHHALWGQVVVWLMNGTTWQSSVWIGTEVDLNWEGKGVGDFNSDGNVDMLLRNKSTGHIRFWRLNGLTHSSTLTPGYAPLVAWYIGGTGDSKYDGDGDGLPDLWERKYFGSLSESGAGDFEGDGMSNLQEYQTGSNPTVGDLSGAAWVILFTPLQ